MMIDNNFVWFTNAPAIALRMNPSGKKINLRTIGPLLLQRAPLVLASMTPRIGSCIKLLWSASSFRGESSVGSGMANLYVTQAPDGCRST